MSDPRPLVVRVAVVTFRRPHLLSRLLTELPQQFADLGNYRASILVVDNDPEQSARDVVPAGVDYVHEPQPGIAAARNAALRSAADADALVFIDDDELPLDGWLRTLLSAWVQGRSDGVAAVAGPVVPRYQRTPAPWILNGPFHTTPDFVSGQDLTHAATGNLLLDLGAVRRLDLAFPDVGTRGGEDTWFTTHLRRRGGRIVWSADAVVEEDVPAERTRARWVAARSLGAGNVKGLSALGDQPGLRDRIPVFATGALRLTGGAAKVAWGLLRRNPATVGGGVHTGCRGAGLALASASLAYDEYARGGRHWLRVRPPRKGTA